MTEDRAAADFPHGLAKGSFEVAVGDGNSQGCFSCGGHTAHRDTGGPETGAGPWVRIRFLALSFGSGYVVPTPTAGQEMSG
jgi:hypothetical protein